MPKITVEEQKEYTLFPPDSILRLRVKEINVRKVGEGDRAWEKLEFVFEITGIEAIGSGEAPSAYMDAVGTVIFGSVPFRLTDSPENKLRQWGEALLNMEMPLGFELDTDYFLRREVRGVTSQYDKKARDKNGQPFKGHQVSALLPIGAITPAPQAPVAAVAPDPWAASANAQLTEDPPF